MKRKVGSFCAQSIIYRASNPEDIFVEIKTMDYPLFVWRGCFCFIGGNWTGEASADRSPKETFLREMKEELQLVKHGQSTAELGETAVHTKYIKYRVKGGGFVPTPEETEMLDELKKAIEETTLHFSDYIYIVPREVFLRADPQSPQTTQVNISSVFTVGLNETDWGNLVELQGRFGNLSCESESHILAMDEIIARNILGMSGQDQILQQFFENKGVARGRLIPMHPGVTVELAGNYLENYHRYLEKFDVERRPRGW